jgi:plasmid stabilization system protein ParE
LRYSVFWLESAVQELEEIRLYLHSQDQADYAARLQQALYAAAQKLQEQPNRGKLLIKLGPQYREIFQKPYRLIYEVQEQDQAVYILAVLHTARDLPSAWAQRSRKPR